MKFAILFHIFIACLLRQKIYDDSINFFVSHHQTQEDEDDENDDDDLFGFSWSQHSAFRFVFGWSIEYEQNPTISHPFIVYHL